MGAEIRMEKKKMPITDAAKRANDKYKKANVVSVLVQFNKRTETELTEYVRALPNKMGYIKNLIKADSGIGADRWVLMVNDEDDVRLYQLHAHTAQDAVEEAGKIISLFRGMLKGRIDTSDWLVVRGVVDDASPIGITDADDDPIYLFK